MFVRKCSLEKTLLKRSTISPLSLAVPSACTDTSFCCSVPQGPINWCGYVAPACPLQLQLKGSSKAPVLLSSQTLLLQEELWRMEMGWFEVLLSAGELSWPSITKVSPLSPAKEQQPGSWTGKEECSFCSFSMRT